jgi:hypothetical protein
MSFLIFTVYYFPENASLRVLLFQNEFFYVVAVQTYLDFMYICTFNSDR